MITPLDIENKTFTKQRLNGYSTDEVDDFLDELAVDYGKMYKDFAGLKSRVESLEKELEHYKNIEKTLNNTLIVAQSTAEEVKDVARKQAEQIVESAQTDAKKSLTEVETQIKLSTKELDGIRKQFDVYKAKMESLLISQLELLKDINKEDE